MQRPTIALRVNAGECPRAHVICVYVCAEAQISDLKCKNVICQRPGEGEWIEKKSRIVTAQPHSTSSAHTHFCMNNCLALFICSPWQFSLVRGRTHSHVALYLFGQCLFICTSLRLSSLTFLDLGPVKGVYGRVKCLL